MTTSEREVWREAMGVVLATSAYGISFGALAVFCAKEFGGIDITATVDGLLNVLLPLLVAFGIVNNPTDKTSL